MVNELWTVYGCELGLQSLEISDWNWSLVLFIIGNLRYQHLLHCNSHWLLQTVIGNSPRDTGETCYL